MNLKGIFCATFVRYLVSEYVKRVSFLTYILYFLFAGQIVRILPLKVHNRFHPKDGVSKFHDLSVKKSKNQSDSPNLAGINYLRLRIFLELTLLFTRVLTFVLVVFTFRTVILAICYISIIADIIGNSIFSINSNS